MRPTLRRPAQLAAFALCLAGCSERDPSAPADPVDTLSAADAADAFDALLGVTVGLYQFRLAPAPGVVTQTIDETRPCPAGGRLRTQGSSTTDRPAERFTAQLQQTHQACQAESASGRRWQFEGDPDLRFEVSFGIATGASTVRMTGRVRTQNDTLTVRCTADVQFSGAPSGVVTLSGRYCGRTVRPTL